MQTLASISEDELIRRLTAELPQSHQVVAGPGDDCAVLRAAQAGRHLLFKTDAVVENVHFLRETPPRQVGRKALARVVSDIAAMGGQPEHAVITLVVRRATEVKYVEELYAGLRELAATFGINIVGGETSRGDTTVVSVSLLGSVPEARWISRRGGKAGDALFVTGRLGGSIKGRHLTFAPRLREGQWLARNFSIHAMMDLSDGLAKDLPRLATAGGLEFIVDDAALPCMPGCTAAQAWGDGEDYELLFAISPRSVTRLTKEWQQAFPKLELTEIGHLVRVGQGALPALAGSGWDHFSSKS